MPVSFFPPAYFGGKDRVLGRAAQSHLTYKTGVLLGFLSWFSTQGKIIKGKNNQEDHECFV